MEAMGCPPSRGRTGSDRSFCGAATALLRTLPGEAPGVAWRRHGAMGVEGCMLHKCLQRKIEAKKWRINGVPAVPPSMESPKRGVDEDINGCNGDSYTLVV